MERAGETPKELSAEFKLSRELRPNLNRVVYHSSLSLPPGENLNDQQWKEVANKYMSHMGFDGSQFVAVKHQDTEHSHIHILASRVRLDGSVVSDSHDYKRSEETVRSIEKEYGLTQVISSREIETRAPTTGELHKALREQTPSAKMQLQSFVGAALEGKPTVSEFFSRLNAVGIESVPNVAKTGTVTGISFIYEGERMKGSDLGKGFT